MPAGRKDARAKYGAFLPFAYGRDNQIGMAALSLAEEALAASNKKTAIQQAIAGAASCWPATRRPICGPRISTAKRTGSTIEARSRTSPGQSHGALQGTPVIR